MIGYVSQASIYLCSPAIVINGCLIPSGRRNLGIKAVIINFAVHKMLCRITCYRQTSSLRRAEPQHLNISHPVLQLSLYNPLKPGVKSIEARC